MKSNKLIYCVVILFITSLLMACGSNGSTGQSQGATVALQAQITPGKPTIFFSQYTSAQSINSVSPLADFTLKSVINSNAGTMASDVSILSETFTFERVGSNPENRGTVLVIPALTYYSNLIVPAGGTATWQNVPIMLAEAKSYLKNNDPLKASTEQLYYKVKVEFAGKEVKNGSKLSVDTTFYLNLAQ